MQILTLQHLAKTSWQSFFVPKIVKKTMGDAISTVKSSPIFQRGSGIIILVDGFSNGITKHVANQAGATPVIEQPSNKFPEKALQ